MSEPEVQQLSDRAGSPPLQTHGADDGCKSGWLALSGFFLEGWDLHSILTLSVLIREEGEPDLQMLGLARVSAQAGGLVGAVLGGYLADRFDRTKICLVSLSMFVLLALAQVFVQDMAQLAAVRFFLGIALGADIVSGYTDIMKSMPEGRRQHMGSRWQLMYVARLAAASFVLEGLNMSTMHHDWPWRSALGLTAVPALVLLVGRLLLTIKVALSRRCGRSADGAARPAQMTGQQPEPLPAGHSAIERHQPGKFFPAVWADPVRRRATVHAWISNAIQGLACLAAPFVPAAVMMPFTLEPIDKSFVIMIYGMGSTRLGPWRAGLEWRSCPVRGAARKPGMAWRLCRC